MLLYIFISLLILLIKMYILKVNSGVDKKTTFKIKTRMTTSISSEAQKNKWANRQSELQKTRIVCKTTKV